MAIACKLCIASKGLRGSEIGGLPQTDEEFWDHCEDVHGLIVKREGESEAQASERYYAKFPDRRR